MNGNYQLTSLTYLGSGKETRLNASRVAATLFNRALSQGLRRRLLGKLTGRGSALQALDHQPVGRLANRSSRITFVPLDQIIGSEGRSDDFDRDFNPLKLHNRDRWVGIAVARQIGVVLPPVELLQEGNHYFVRDGHHRISVAKTMGQLDIEARIVN